MKVLVAFASRHHSTQEIAEVIAKQLTENDIDVDLRRADAVADIAGYEAVVLGSAVYMGAWLPPAWSFVERFRTTLERIPVWLFSSGPIGFENAVPQGAPSKLAELMQATQARNHQIFAGKLDSKCLSLGERLVTKIIRPPEGDFRDWESIHNWAEGIGASLQPQNAH